MSPQRISAQGFASKTAQVTVAFWIMKVLATTLGETAGDFTSMTLELGYYAGLAITFAALVLILGRAGSERSTSRAPKRIGYACCWQPVDG